MKNSNSILWEQYLEAFKQYQKAAMQFRQSQPHDLELVKAGLYNPDERQAALNYIELLTLEELKQLILNLVSIAVTENGSREYALKQILRIPTDWLRENIEETGKTILQKEGDEVFWELLELYRTVDFQLALQVAKKELSNSSKEIQEASLLFVDKYNKNSN